MSYKPADFFVGIVDTFGILAPGAILVFAAVPFGRVLFADDGLFPPIPDGPQQWIAFIVVSYVAGHLIWVVASAALDPLYDRLYSRARRLPKVRRTPWPWKLFWRAAKLKDADIHDPLYAAALEIRAKRLEQLEPDTKTKLGDESAYSWAQSVVMLHSPEATGDIERMQASSKFFRSLALTLLIILLIWPLRVGVLSLPAYLAVLAQQWLVTGGVAAAVIVMSLLFMRLRWDATQRTYEYYVARYLDPKPKTEGSGSS